MRLLFVCCLDNQCTSERRCQVEVLDKNERLSWLLNAFQLFIGKFLMIFWWNYLSYQLHAILNELHLDKPSLAETKMNNACDFKKINSWRDFREMNLSRSPVINEHRLGWARICEKSYEAQINMITRICKPFQKFWAEQH